MSRRLARLAIVSVAILAACGREAPVSVTEQSLPEPAQAREPDFLENQRVRIWPNSARIRPGVPYRFRFYGHCGLEHSTPDFDGHLWDFVPEPDTGGPNPPRGFGNPVDEGTMTLIATNVAEYRSSWGRFIRFRRIFGPKVVDECL